MTDYSIWPSTNGPFVDGSDGPYNLATQFRLSVPAWLKAIRFWRGTTNIVAPILGRVWAVTGSLTGDPVPNTDVSFTLSGTGWQSAPTPLFPKLSAGQDYRVAIATGAFYTGTARYWLDGPGLGGITSGIINAPDTITSGNQGTFISQSGYAYPNQTFQGGNYWVDVIVSDTDPTPAPVGGNMSIADIARTNMIAQLGLTDAQARVLSNADLMAKVLVFPGQTLVTKTDASVGTHLLRYMMSLR